MDKLTEYPKSIKRILAEYRELSNRRNHPDIETLAQQVFRGGESKEEIGNIVWKSISDDRYAEHKLNTFNR